MLKRVLTELSLLLPVAPVLFNSERDGGDTSESQRPVDAEVEGGWPLDEAAFSTRLLGPLQEAYGTQSW